MIYRLHLIYALKNKLLSYCNGWSLVDLNHLRILYKMGQDFSRDLVTLHIFPSYIIIIYDNK